MKTLGRGNRQESFGDAVLGDGNTCHAVACWVKQEAWMVIDRL
jgi:hypothetical protein